MFPVVSLFVAETDLLQKIAKLCRATYLTANARMDTVQKCSITARTGLERCTVRARNRLYVGWKEYLLWLECGTIWTRKRHQLSSKLARKHPKAGLESKQIWHEKQRSHHFGRVKCYSNTTIEKKQIKFLNSEYMIYGISALNSSRLV